MEGDNDEVQAMLERVVALLREARRKGWEIALKHTGDLRGRARFEITVWCELPAENDASSPSNASASAPATDTPNLPPPMQVGRSEP